MCRIDGPFFNRGKYRLRVVDRESKKTKSYTFETEADAKAAIPKLVAEYRRNTGVQLAKALDDYAQHLAQERQNRPSTIETTLGRIRALFCKPDVTPLVVLDVNTNDLTPASVRKLFEAFKRRPVNKAGKLPSVDSQVGVLKQSRTFANWLQQRGYTKRNDLFEGLQVLGKRRRGKPQLRIDEARRYKAAAIELADQGDVGAIAALVPLYMGNRAGEVVARRVRDLDDRGRLLYVEYAKTDAGNRALEVPEVLQSYLLKLAHGKQADAPLFTGAVRRAHKDLEQLADPVAWLRRQVWRMCKVASVPKVGPHGLRGTCGTIAAEQGMTSRAIANALGHAGTAVTERHYIKPEALDNARAERVAAALNQAQRWSGAGRVVDAL